VWETGGRFNIVLWYGGQTTGALSIGFLGARVKWHG
jgi:hypothetical protein